MKNKGLLVAIIVALLLAAWGCSGMPRPAVDATLASLNPAVDYCLSVETFAARLALVTQRPVTLVDVRTPAEFASGHLRGAVNIDFFDSSFTARVRELPKGNDYLVYCKSGSRTTKARTVMLAEGIARVWTLAGSLPAWIASGREVVVE